MHRNGNCSGLVVILELYMTTCLLTFVPAVGTQLLDNLLRSQSSSSVLFFRKRRYLMINLIRYKRNSLVLVEWRELDLCVDPKPARELAAEVELRNKDLLAAGGELIYLVYRQRIQHSDMQMCDF